jgi:chondroitin AC lyase
MKGNLDNETEKTIVEAMKENGSFQGINYADLSRTAGFPPRRPTENLGYRAKAYKSKSSSIYKNKK